jgi:hypothetical protein
MAVEGSPFSVVDLCSDARHWDGVGMNIGKRRQRGQQQKPGGKTHTYTDTLR